MRDALASPDAPAAIGPYSQAVRLGDLVMLSGQTPIDPGTGKLLEGGISEQTAQVFRNLGAVLAAAGLGFEHVQKCNVYLTDMADFAAMNAVYLGIFTAPFPARTTVAVAALPMGASVEIELTARR